MASQVIKLQASIGKELSQLLVNFKKESKIRLEKSEVVLNYADRANGLVKSFNENHVKLLKNFDELKTLKYFSDNYHDIVQEDYIKIKNLISAKLTPFGMDYPPLEKPSVVDDEKASGSDDKKNDDEKVEVESIHESILNDEEFKSYDQNEQFEKLNDTVIHSKITSTPNAKKNVSNAGNKMCSSIVLFGNELNKMENFMLDGFKMRVKIAIPFLQTNYQKISDEMNNLFVNNVIVGVEAENCKLQFDELQERFFDLLAIANDCREKPGIEPISLKLKPIQIPTFNGKNYADWPTFSQLFTSLIIENKSLSDIQKMQYLKTNVTDDAAKVIADLRITNEHFELAWNLLNSKYNNARIICSMRIEKLINQPNIIIESWISLKNLHDVSRECWGLLKNISAEQIILFILTKKLDKETHKMYEQQLKNPKEEQKLDEFLEFIEKRYQVLEAVGDSKNSRNDLREKPRDNKSNDVCICCKFGHHLLYKCSKFLKMLVKDRRDFVYKNKLCVLCLQFGHRSEKCFLKKNCEKCGRKHNTLLHFDDSEMKTYNKNYEHKKPEQKKAMLLNVIETNKNEIGNEETENGISRSVQLFYASNGNDVALATARVRLKLKYGWSEPINALIDQGATASVISAYLAKLFKYDINKGYFDITGLGGVLLAKSKGFVDVEITARFESSWSLSFSAIVVNKINALLAETTEIDKSVLNLPEFKSLTLADPQFFEKTRIDMLLGSDVFYEILDQGLIKPQNTGLLLQSTTFGWIVSGSLQRRENVRLNKINKCYNIKTENLDEMLQRFWSIEYSNEADDVYTETEKYCLQHFKNNIKRSADGKYIVSLPFDLESGKLGNSKRAAMAQFLQLEQRFRSNDVFKKLYFEFINEYLKLGHMKLCEPTLESESFYLPHHAVFKDSTTTKLRTVFDASRPTSTGISLNDKLLVGPKLQENLFNIMLRFRIHRIAFTADIAKMYRQIWMDESQCDYQKILWRWNENEDIKEYRLTTITYGTSPAPFLATAVVKYHAESRMNDFPEACEKIIKDSYMDDVSSGCDDVNTAIRLQREITAILAEAGMPLRKWATNNLEFLNKIPLEHREGAPLNFDVDNESSISTLGMSWNCKDDKVGFVVRLKNPLQHYTKRQILSEISRMYDPIGLLSPVIVASKIIMQSIWKEGCDWDDIVADHICKQWRQIRDELHIVTKLQIDRWIKYRPNCRVELHGFADASGKAYGPAIYIKVYLENKVYVNIIASKSRIAPINKTVTLPKLELCAAHLLTKLMTEVKKSLKINIAATKYYSDSEITIAWIKSTKKKYKQFVANRVNEIREVSEPSEWFWIGTKENPADFVSRGLLPSQIINNEMWWHGPKWLLENENNFQEVNLDVDSEVKKDIKVFHVSVNEDIIDRFSSFKKAIRVIAFCLRFYKKLKLFLANKGENKERVSVVKSDIILEIEELNAAKIILVKLSQNKHFSEDMNALKNDKQVLKSSKLKNLFPFIDSDGVLRVGGRLQNSNFDYNKKHPIILSYKSNLSTMIVKDAHLCTLHGGNQLTLAQIRHEFWIMHAKRVVKTFINKCVICFRYRSTTTTQLMGNLPADRTKMLVKPFTNCGTDLCGPVWVRVTAERGVRAKKGYIVIFICFSTKAVHLEVVSDLTSEAFLAAFKRLIGRRGNVSHLYCDNATNFTGTQRILELDSEEAIKQYNNDLKQKLIALNTRFIFNPPAAPWFGGLWERNVGSIKYHLKRSVADRKLTYEELSTVLIQIESILNSRPLCPLSENPDDLEALTPGHFLVGAALTAPVESSLVDIKENRLGRWELLTKIKQDFWHQWSNEYASRLQIRTKWTEPTKNIEEGDMVLVKDEITAPLNWPLGRIKKVYPAADELVRVVDVLANGKVYKRPVGKLSVLPVDKPVEERERGGSQVLSPLLISIIVFFGLFSVAFGAKISNFERDPGAIFEKCGQVGVIVSKWNLVARMEMSVYYDQFSALQGDVDAMKKLCGRFSKKKKEVTACDLLFSTITDRMATIIEKDVIIRMNAKNFDEEKKKRGVGLLAVATIFGTFIGSIGTKVASWFDENKSTRRMDDLENTIRTQTSIINMTEHALEKMQSAIYGDLADHINKVMNLIASEGELSRISDEIHWLSLQLLFAITGFENLQNSIIENIGISKNGIKLIWITRERLQNHIELMEQSLPSNLGLFGETVEEKLEAVYRLSRTNLFLSQREMILTFEVPLFEKMYECNEIIPIPMKRNESFVTISTKFSYIFISDMKLFYLVTQDEMDKCEEFNSYYVCTISSPLRQVNSSLTCELGLYLQKTVSESHCTLTRGEIFEFWRRVHGHWVFSLNHTEARIHCGNETNIVTLNGAGILDMENCQLSTSDVFLRSFDVIGNEKFNISSLHYGHFNFSRAEEPIEPIRLDFHKQHFDKLKLAIDKVDNQYFHHVHHYTLGYILVALIILVTCFLVIKFKVRSIHNQVARDAS